MSGVASYGSYSHDPDEITTILHELQPVLSPQGRPFLRRSLVTIRGTVLAADRDELEQKLAALESAYEETNNNFRYRIDGRLTRHKIDDVETATLRYLPNGRYGPETEYLNRRSFEVRLEGRTVESGIWTYRDRITRIGNGGPRQRYIGSLTGTPQLQTLQAKTTVRYVQQGSAVGVTGHVTPPGNTLPGVPLNEAESETLESAQAVIGGRAVLFGSSWRYVSEALSGGNVVPQA